MQDEFIYKILTKSEFESLKNNNYFEGTKKDIDDGFIHFSKKDQLIGTLNKFYKNQKNLMLLKISSSNLDNLKWENTNDGQIFPHLYSKLNTQNILVEYQIKDDLDGKFILPTDY